MAESRENSAELLQPDAHLWNQMLSYIKSESLRCAIQLGIPDAVHQHGKPMKLSELIAALSIHPAKASHMYRLLRVLVNSGFCVQEKADDDEHEQVYTLTSAGRRTLGDAFPSSRNAVLLMLDPIHRKAFQFLSEWVMNDDPSAFHTAFGMSHWDYTAQDPRFNDLFNQAMGKISEVVRKVLIIIELLTEAENQEAADWSEAYNLFDMQMMAVHGGKERSKKDWESVFFTAGFTD